MNAPLLSLLDSALGMTEPMHDQLDKALHTPIYYETLKPQPNQLRSDIESVLRENTSHHELQAFPELTDYMIDEMERLVYDYAQAEKESWLRAYRQTTGIKDDAFTRAMEES